MKCKNCGMEIIMNIKLSNNNPYYKSNFKKKLYCNSTCSLEYWRNKKRKEYVLRDTEHNMFVKRLNNIIKGNSLIKHNGSEYNPDIIKGDIEYEIELFRKILILNSKSLRWNKDKKHIIIICPSKESIKLFDEAYFYDGENLYNLNKTTIMEERCQRK